MVRRGAVRNCGDGAWKVDVGDFGEANLISVWEAIPICAEPSSRNFLPGFSEGDSVSGNSYAKIRTIECAVLPIFGEDRVAFGKSYFTLGCDVI